MYASADLGGNLWLLAEHHPAIFELVAVGTAVLAGLFLAGTEQFIKSVWHRKTRAAKKAKGPCAAHPRGRDRAGGELLKDPG